MTNASSHGMITSRFIVALRRAPEWLTPIPKQNDHISVRDERTDEIARRRALVMISAPTPGKSTLTENLDVWARGQGTARPGFSAAEITQLTLQRPSSVLGS